MRNAIETSGLAKHYGDVIAVDDLSLTVRTGEIYGFLGLNGAGKTTTIRMLLGMVRRSSGTAHVLGEAVRPDASSLWADVGYMVETPHAYPELSVRENLQLFARLRGLDDRVVAESIDRLGLSSYADRRASALSLGNAQRLGLAKALLHAPKLLILDEPANGLDPAGVVEIRDLLTSLARDGTTVFMSSHILSEVARLTTRIGIIHGGRLIEETDAEALDARRERWLIIAADDHATARSVLDRAGFAPIQSTDGIWRIGDVRAIEQPDAVARLLVEAGAPPSRLAVEEEDLETYFLRLVARTERTTIS